MRVSASLERGSALDLVARTFQCEADKTEVLGERARVLKHRQLSVGWDLAIMQINSLPIALDRLLH